MSFPGDLKQNNFLKNFMKRLKYSFRHLYILKRNAKMKYFILRKTRNNSILYSYST